MEDSFTDITKGFHKAFTSICATFWSKIHVYTDILNGYIFLVLSGVLSHLHYDSTQIGISHVQIFLVNKRIKNVWKMECLITKLMLHQFSYPSK